MISLDKNFLRGSYPPLITPFRGGAVDFEAHARLLERQIAEGSHGVVVNGTTAEPSTLTVEERNQLVRLAVQTARGRIPVVAATGSQSQAETVELTTAAEEAGADAVLVVTPYFIRPPQRGLVEYYVDIGRRTRLPILIYHIPGRAAVNVEADTIELIAERAPNLVGIKHATNDLALVTQVLGRLGTDFRIFVGASSLAEGSAQQGNAIEWAWALNAASSVLGSVLAMVIAIQFGLSWTLASGALAYLLALALVPRLRTL